MAYEHKTKKTKQTVSSYINAIENPDRKKDAKVVLAMMKKITGKRPAIWGTSIVGFDQYTFEGKSGITGVWPMTGFSARKTALTIYLMVGFDKKQELLKKLGPHKTGKSCLYIKKLEQVDTKILEQLIREDYKEMQKRYT